MSGGWERKRLGHGKRGRQKRKATDFPFLFPLTESYAQAKNSQREQGIEEDDVAKFP